MVESNQETGREIDTEIVWRKSDGTLIYSSKSIKDPPMPISPEVPIQPSFKGYKDFILKQVRYQIECATRKNTINLIGIYEELRAHYCQVGRNQKIPMKYRTGDSCPRTQEEAKKEIKMLYRNLQKQTRRPYPLLLYSLGACYPSRP